jgi:hypothetical protein
MSDSTKHPGSWGDPSNPNVDVQRLDELTTVVEYEAYLNHLQDAERSISKALDCLYKHDGVRRGIGYRVRLGRAQSITMTLLVREINHKEGYQSGGGHEWELVGNEWECIYCEQRTKPKQVGPRLVFGPNLLRRVPFYGKKWRCHG